MAEIRIADRPSRRAVVILTPVLLLVAVALLLPAAIRAAAHSGLAALGFSDARGGSVSLGLHHVRIAAIRIGGQSRASVKATFSADSLLRGRLKTIDVSDTELHGTVALNGAPRLDGFTAPVPQQEPAGPIQLPVDKVNLQGIVLELETPAGTVRAKADGTLTGSEDSLHLAGTLSIAGDSFTGSAPVDFSLTPIGWTVTLTPIHVDFAGKTSEANAIDGSLSLDSSAAGLTGNGGLKGENLDLGEIAIQTLALDLKADAGTLSGRFRLAPRQGGSGIDASLTSDDKGITGALKADLSNAAVFGKAVGAPVTGPLQARLVIHADPPGDKRPVTLDLAYSGIAPGGAVLRNATLKAAGLFDSVRNSLSLTGCGPFSVDSATLSGLAVTKLSGCVGPMPDNAGFSQDPQGGVALAISFNTLAATIPSGDGVLAEAKVPALRMTLSGNQGKLDSFTTDLDGGSIDLPSLGTGLHNLGIKAQVAGDGSLSGTIAGSFGSSAPKSPALPLAGTLGGALGKVSLTATAGSLIKLNLTGQQAKLDLPATELGVGGADLLGLAPGLATVVSKLSGTLALSLSADWSGQALNSSGSLSLKNIGATTPNFTLEGLDGTIALTSLVPLATADAQVLTMKRLVAGIPLTEGQVTFGLDPHGKLNIADAHWTLAGGRIGTYDQQLDLYGPDQNLGLVVKDVDLAELLKLANLEGLSAEGTVEGTVPLRRIKDIIRIEHGVLQTSAPGVIRYDPVETPSFLQGQPGEGTAILRDALKDFRYRELSLTIDGLLGGEEQIKVSLNGANPTLYGGVPISLNVNLSGALDSIARSSVEAYTNPTKAMHRKLQTKQGDKK